MKTRAQLFRDAKSGTLSLLMTERFGKEPTVHMAKKRKVIGANTVSLKLQNEDGNISTMDVPKASLVEYTNNELVIYTYGYRKPTTQEQKVLEEWDKIQNTKEYQERNNIDILTDGSSTYWQKKKFFRDNNAEYLMGFERQKGCCLDFNRQNEGKPDFISDESIKGEVILRYKVYME